MSPWSPSGVAGRWAACAAIVALGSCAVSPRHAIDSRYVANLESLALLQTLNAELLSHDSATATLQHWCEIHRLAAPPRIVADRVTGAELEPSPEQRALLAVSATDAVRHRRVRLRCGEVVMSEADNWYVPSRLTAEMNAELDASDTPFGRVVQSLSFRRRTLSSELLWQPLPEAWWQSRSTAGGERMNPPPHVLRHRALLTLPDGRPISLVVETYTREALPERP